MRDRLDLTANHHAVAALQAPDSAAGADIDVVDAFRGECLGATDVVDIVGITAVDEDVVGFQMRHDVSDRLVHTAAGTISHTVRGFSSLFTRSASAVAPTAFSLVNSFTDCGDTSKTTH
jgi:hypothetical protein